MNLNRSIEQWRGGVPEAIAAGSPAQVLFALQDAKHDVLALADEVKRLERLVYVPGLRKCPKCRFVLISNTIHVGSGNISAHDAVGEPCPNCTTPLWRVSERDAGNEMADRCEVAVLESQRLAAEVERQKAEIASLRLSLGGKARSDTPEPYGCPMPGACQTVAEIARLRVALASVRAFVQDEVDTRISSFTVGGDIATLDNADGECVGEATDCLARIDAALAAEAPK